MRLRIPQVKHFGPFRPADLARGQLAGVVAIPSTSQFPSTFAIVIVT